MRPWIREESSVSEERFGGAAYGGGRSAEAEARGQHNLVAGETHANGTPMDRQQHDNTTAQSPDDHAVGGDGSDARMARILSAAREAAGQHGARPYQREIILDCLGQTESPRTVGIEPLHGRRSRSVLIQAPTGAGKTFIGLLCAAVMQRELGVRVGWCAGRRELLRQADEENRKFGFGLDVSMISMFDRTPPKVDLLVIDEAHHDGALSMATLHGVIDPSHVIGLTATPFRRDRVKLCFEKTIRSCSIQSLVDDGYLSRYRHFTVPGWRPEDIARLYADERGRWGRSLIFFQTRVEAERCCEHLRGAGVRVELVTGSSDRDRQIARFEAGEAEVLISMNVLTEGFDCPSLQTVFCRPSSRLPTVQMCGRVFRRHPSLPLKQIVQPRESEMPFTRFVRPEEQWLLTELGWRSLGATKELDGEVEAMRQRLAQIKVALPMVITRTKQRSDRGRNRFAVGDEA
jgi:superfamily II DNA or RNA helicase